MKEHSGIAGNEYADFKAEGAVAIGTLTHRRQTATTTGFRQEYFADRVSKQVKNWDRNSLKGLTYVVTAKGAEGMATQDRESRG